MNKIYINIGFSLVVTLAAKFIDELSITLRKSGDWSRQGERDDVEEEEEIYSTVLEGNIFYSDLKLS